MKPLIVTEGLFDLPAADTDTQASNIGIELLLQQLNELKHESHNSNCRFDDVSIKNGTLYINGQQDPHVVIDADGKYEKGSTVFYNKNKAIRALSPAELNIILNSAADNSIKKIVINDHRADEKRNILYIPLYKDSVNNIDNPVIDDISIETTGTIYLTNIIKKGTPIDHISNVEFIATNISINTNALSKIPSINNIRINARDAVIIENLDITSLGRAKSTNNLLAKTNFTGDAHRMLVKTKKPLAKAIVDQLISKSHQTGKGYNNIDDIKPIIKEILNIDIPSNINNFIISYYGTDISGHGTTVVSATSDKFTISNI